MANRNNVNPKGSEDNDDIDDLPSVDEIKGDDTSGITDARANGQTTTSGMSRDEMDERGFNDERDEETRLKLTTPGGDWLKKERWVCEERVYANDSMPDDFDPAGRTFFIFKGPAEPRVANNGHVYAPEMYLRISPDIRYKPDNPDQLDMPHKLFIRAKDFFLDVRGERATPRKLIDFLENDDYTVNTMPGNNGGSPYITDIKKNVQRRR